MYSNIHPALRPKSEAHEETLAILEGTAEENTQEGVGSLIDDLIDRYRGRDDGATEDVPPKPVLPTEQPPAKPVLPTETPQKLNELADLLNLRGRLQQMGATFNESGELLTYGLPESSTEFKFMLELGPLYEKQWNTVFVEGYVADDDGVVGSCLRTLKKALNNEGILFGNASQRYSLGDASPKLQALCRAYDALWVAWQGSSQIQLPTKKGAKLETITEGEETIQEEEEKPLPEQSKQDHDSGYATGEDFQVPDIMPTQLDITKPLPNLPVFAPRNNLSRLQEPLVKQRRAGIILDSVPLLYSIERAAVATRNLPETDHTRVQSVVGELVLSPPSPPREAANHPATSCVPKSQHIPVTPMNWNEALLVRNWRETHAMGTQAGGAHNTTTAEGSGTNQAHAADQQNNEHGKHDKKLRKLAKQILGLKK